MRSSLFSSRTTSNAEKGFDSFYAKTPFQQSKRWSRICIVCVRIAFGGIWTWNACLLGQCLTTQAASAYIGRMITASQQGGQHISAWSNFWQHIAIWHPVGFLLLCVLGIGLVACGLLFLLLANVHNEHRTTPYLSSTLAIFALGSILALFFWSTQLVSLVPGIQAGDTGVLLVFLLTFLGFTLVTVSSQVRYPHTGQRKSETRLPPFAPANVDTANRATPKIARGIAQGASFADIQTRAMSKTSASNRSKKEVVGAHTRQFTSNHD